MKRNKTPAWWQDHEYEWTRDESMWTRVLYLGIVFTGALLVFAGLVGLFTAVIYQSSLLLFGN